jgi:hypothetical protein
LNLATRGRDPREDVGRRWPTIVLDIHRVTGERNQSLWRRARHARRFRASGDTLVDADQV